MSIETELAELSVTKQAIKTAIEDAGITVGDIPFSQYPEKITEIPEPSGLPEVLVHYQDGTVRRTTVGRAQGAGTLVSSSSVYSVASPDRSKVVFNMGAAVAPQLYDVSTGALSAIPGVAAGNAASENACQWSFSPDGSLFAMGSTSTPYARVYNTTTWAVHVALPTPVISMNSALVFSPDGQWLARAGNSSPYLTLYDTATWTRRDVPGLSSPVCAVAWSGDSSELAFVHSAGNVLRRLDVAANTMKTDSATMSASIGTDGRYDIAYSDDDQFVVLAGHQTAPALRVYNRSANTWRYSTSRWALGVLAAGLTKPVAGGSLLLVSATNPRAAVLSSADIQVQSFLSGVGSSPRHITPLY